ncbi:MAG TPA: LamG domain-containing protein [Candidatus Aminicenantes bacterium]|nr:LamG domain-containing protein [Candidatus Aminicenantes bacterium]HRY64595.1 LamG domain-containing protein [Candidatus Aminicenantes bacterium]HRZ71508.1 LamG domain-containing protein [Candidatus Aminicenantes bacterium]
MSKKLAVIILAVCAARAAAQEPRVSWSFETLDGARTTESVRKAADTLEGNVEKAPGVRGLGLRLDGFTTCLRAPGSDRVVTGDEITVEAWVALGEYPWNWCPILTSESDEVKGYRLMIGPLGQASLECAVGGQWLACTSERGSIPLRTWMHVVGVYRARSEMSLYINGTLAASNKISGAITQSRAGYILGMVARPAKPSDIHRVRGTVAANFGLDGILDEVRVYDRALTAAAIKERAALGNGLKPDIAPRRLPTIERNPGRFGAYYTKLKYYPAWDRLWPVDQDPDIVVCFPGSAVRLVFWRGIRYGASWVSENESWMSDQSVEAWESAAARDPEGCYEHMQDRHCRFSHVRIIENTEARVVIHWRYAPVSAYDHTWNADPKTGWECWIDEYYTIYPDRGAVRKVSWKTGTLGDLRQFQETLALLHPGQIVSDLLEKDFAVVADYAGKTAKLSYVDDPDVPPYGPFSWDVSQPYTVQQYQFKSLNKPFICFEPGNRMFLRFENLASYGRASGCNHFPVGQARCDGRTTMTSDRPSHCSSFPISDPVIHEKDGREYWAGLYGMTDWTVPEVVAFGRSWAYPAELVLKDPDVRSEGYDRGQRCYQLVNATGRPQAFELRLMAGASAPAVHPVFRVQGWNGERPRILVDGRECPEARVGLDRRLEGDQLIVFLPIEAKSPVTVRIVPD